MVTGAAVWRGSSHDAKSSQAPMQRTHVAGNAATTPDEPEMPPDQVVESARQAAPLAPVGAAREPLPTTDPAAPSAAPDTVRAGTHQAPTEAASEAPEVAASGSERRAGSTALNTAGSAAGPSHKASSQSSSHAHGVGKPEARRSDSSSARSKSAATGGPAQTADVRTSAVSGTNVAPPSEISLLRSAQVALAGRPREAFQLTQQHRRLYPAGEFAQERDALAIQALMRSGDTEQARDLAQAFIRAYPSSPHAHRFREAMGIH
jgi:hypothetical protein